ncbi:MAG: DUF721 domain-containing protein [bacterium]
MERVGALLHSLEGAEVLRRRIAEARGLASWPEIVGTHLAERTRPLQLAGGRLFVLCHGSALRQELAFHKREILRRFRDACASPVVAREIVLLESDANLSSLVREAEAGEAPGGRRGAAGSSAAPGITADEPGGAVEHGPAAEEPSLAAKVAAAYPRFDGAAYREEMRRIAEGG